MLKNYRNTLKICLFGKTTKQLSGKFEPWNLENTSNFEGWDLSLVAYKIISVNKKKIF